MNDERPSTIYGLPIVQSALIPDGEIWTFFPSEKPGFPRLVRLVLGESPDGDDPEADK